MCIGLLDFGGQCCQVVGSKAGGILAVGKDRGESGLSTAAEINQTTSCASPSLVPEGLTGIVNRTISRSCLKSVHGLHCIEIKYRILIWTPRGLKESALTPLRPVGLSFLLHSSRAGQRGATRVPARTVPPPSS